MTTNIQSNTPENGWPSIEKLRELLYVDCGILKWKGLAGPQSFRNGKEAGYLHNTDGYRRVMVAGKMMLSHQAIFAIHNGFYATMTIDHANKNKTDNRPENLREVCQQANSYNREISKHNKSGVTGVRFVPKKNKWVAYGRSKYKYTHLGVFSEKADAVAARKLWEDQTIAPLFR